MIIQPIVDIPHICFLSGIKYVVISPGSRSAHLTLAFARYPEITKYVIPDERSAAYIGLGLAQSSGHPVVLVCTSGTASVNFYPAIVEAYYQNVPLIALTADRPALWVDKNDGQAIRQNGLFENHIKKSYLFPENFNSQSDVAKSQKIVTNAIKEAVDYPQGPVHINVPIPEPFYPGALEEMRFNDKIDRSYFIGMMGNEAENEYFTAEELAALKGKKIAIVAGQATRDTELETLLDEISTKKGIPVFADVISNLNEFETVLRYHDSFDLPSNNLVPDLIITFGRSILSKRLKLALRASKGLIHYHIQENDFPADTYLSLKKTFRNSPKRFFKELMKDEIDGKEDYYKRLSLINHDISKRITNFISQSEFGEFKAFNAVLKAMPEDSVIHLANSMPVRYANILGGKKKCTVYANRGTSGIDGSNSTALGHALNGNKQNYLLTGDMAFFYDRNAFWHNHLPSNLKIVIFNNHGGGIFRLIDGPNIQPELEQYFETDQKLTAKNTALDFGMDYYFCDKENELEDILPKFISQDRRLSILEIETDKFINQKVFHAYKQLIKNGT